MPTRTRTCTSTAGRGRLRARERAGARRAEHVDEEGQRARGAAWGDIRGMGDLDGAIIGVRTARSSRRVLPSRRLRRVQSTTRASVFATAPPVRATDVGVIATDAAVTHDRRACHRHRRIRHNDRRIGHPSPAHPSRRPTLASSRPTWVSWFIDGAVMHDQRWCPGRPRSVSWMTEVVVVADGDGRRG